MSIITLRPFSEVVIIGLEHFTNLEKRILEIFAKGFRKSPYLNTIDRKQIIEEIKDIDEKEVDKAILDLHRFKQLTCHGTAGSAHWHEDGNKPHYTITFDAHNYWDYVSIVGEQKDDIQKIEDMILKVEEISEAKKSESINESYLEFCKKLVVDPAETLYILHIADSVGYFKINRSGNKLEDTRIEKINPIGEMAAREIKIKRDKKTRFNFLSSLPALHAIILHEYQEFQDFKQKKDWRHSIISAGTIIETLMQYYVETHTNCGIALIDKNKFEKDFNQLSKEFIQQNIFGEKRNWIIIQSHLRDWRNFIHLRKELKEGYSLNEATFLVIEPVFETMIEAFAKNW